MSFHKQLRAASAVDDFVSQFDHALRTVSGVLAVRRTSPASALADGELSESERAHSAALMRVNHVGEVCAQALYQGQALMARDPANRRALEAAALEEQDHLAWSAERIRDLGGKPSLLNPVWYAASVGLGVAAGALGDRWSLAFLVETERQVEQHLAGHLGEIAVADARTRAVVAQMQVEESRHRAMAESMGAARLPSFVQGVMRAFAKAMTTVSYRL